MNVTGTCVECGSGIEFAAEQTGETIACPTCQRPTVLALPKKTLLGGTATPKADPRLMICPDCDAAISRKALFCPNCGAVHHVRFGLIWTIMCQVAAASALLGLIGWLLLLLFNAAWNANQP